MKKYSVHIVWAIVAIVAKSTATGECAPSAADCRPGTRPPDVPVGAAVAPVGPAVDAAVDDEIERIIHDLAAIQ